VSRFRTRHLATILAAALGLTAALVARPASALPDDTWAPMSLQLTTGNPVFALAADPAQPGVVLVGTGQGQILRSGDGGVSWSAVAGGLGHGVLVIAFDPSQPAVVLAGTRGDGIWRSLNGGLSWQRDPGESGATVRALAFAPGLELAGGDEGVLVRRSGGAWRSIGLGRVRISGLAVVDQADVVAGGDDAHGGRSTPLYTGGADGHWAPVAAGPTGFAGASMVTALAAQPGATGIASVLMGTNTGLFRSEDGGRTWSQLTGGGSLPATDFNGIAFVPGRPSQFYVASDGGGSDLGGLWVTRDGGIHFESLDPPVPAVTALAVAGQASVPTVYATTFDPGDQAVALWSYRDAGGPPAATPAPVPTPRSRPAPAPPPRERLAALLRRPETPWLGLGAVALLVVLVAVGAYVRRERQL
jgi:photosystem II stability/assembly factor-like uncharacterized protein